MPRTTKGKTEVASTASKRIGAIAANRAQNPQSAGIIAAGIRTDIDLVQLLLAVAHDVVGGHISTAAGRCVVGAATSIIKIAELNLRYKQQILPPMGRTAKLGSSAGTAK